MNTRYIKLAFASVAVLALACCSKNDPEPRPVTKIEYAFTRDGENVDFLEFSSAPRTVQIGMTLNNKDLNWSVTSDREWCRIQDGSGRGSGSFDIVLPSNDSFSSRDTATITFTAGLYTGTTTLTVTQLGTDFILSQCLFLSSRDGDSFTDITAKADTSATLTVNCPGWVTYDMTGEEVEGSIRTTTFTLTTSANPAGERSGMVYLSGDGGSTENTGVYIHQFGDEMKYDDQGYMIMPAGSDSTFCFDVPNDVLDMEAIDKGHAGKDYVSVAAQAGGECTTVYVSFEDNLNDCMESRTASGMFITLYNAAKAYIPTLFQSYESCHGINTAKGLLSFAMTVNEGGDTSPWMKEDGIVHVMTSIDMSSVTTSWPGIGTDAHPFTGSFDGGYYTISGLVSMNPLFGVCNGASVSAVTLDDSDKFFYSEDPAADTGISLAAVAGKIFNTTMKDCTSAASVLLNKPVSGSGISIHVAGIVGSADASSTLSSCQNDGMITAGESLETTGRDTLYIAGIAGCSKAVLKNCTNSGAVSDGAVCYRHYVGGVCADSDNAVNGCTNSGAIVTSSVRVNPTTGEVDQSRFFQVGGIAGCASAEISDCTNAGTITNNTNVKTVETGGIAGVIDAPMVNLTGNSNSGVISSTAAVRYNTIGGLYGTLAAKQELSLPSGSETSDADIFVTEAESTTITSLCVGGYVGTVRNVPLTIRNAVWTHSVSVTLNKSAYTLAYLSLGGILGGSYNPTADDSSPASVTIENCRSEDAAVNVIISPCTSASYTYGARLGAMALVVGTVNGDASIESCITSGELGIGAGSTAPKTKLNGYASIVAGTVGCIVNGSATIKDCTNKAQIRNYAYNNNAWSDTYSFDSGLVISRCNITAGVVGEYLGPENPQTCSMEVTNCFNSGAVSSYRGVAGGIAGYVRDASLQGCSAEGSLGSGERSYIGGIVGLGNNVTATRCTAVCPLAGVSKGSEIYSAGGILGIAQGIGSIEGCSYFGDITNNNAGTAHADEEAYGAVVGNTIATAQVAVPSYSISSSKWGGRLLNDLTAPVELSADNFMQYAVGSSTISAGGASVGSGCSWWDGK